MLHKDGHIGWIESMCVPIMNDNNEMIGALGINRDITERMLETERLNNLAHYDQLTDIPNRYLLLDRLTHLIDHCERYQSSFALLYIDLDNFKQFNDTLGHAFGDEILKETALRLKDSIRNSDTVARIGGDEFVVLLEKVSEKDDISKIAEQFIDTLHKPYVIKNESHKVSGSIGVAIYPNDGNTDQLLSSADQAMYKAKQNGRDTYEF